MTQVQRRNYLNTVDPTALNGGIDNAVTSITVDSTAGFPTPPFLGAIERKTANEEVVLVTAVPDGTHFTVTRGFDGTAAVAHGDDVLFEHVVASIDYDQANGIANFLTNPPADGRVVVSDGAADWEMAWTDLLTAIRLQDWAETFVDHGNAGATETIDLADGNVHRLVLDASDCAISIANPPPAGQTTGLTVQLVQDATGGRTVTWPANFTFAGGTAPILSTDASAIDVVTGFYDPVASEWRMGTFGAAFA